MESTPISLISELNEVNRESEISESLMILPDTALSSSADSVYTSDLSASLKSTIDISSPSSGHASWNVAKSSEFDGSKFGSMEAEVIAGFLREARTLVLDYAGLDAESKKILDALVEIVVEDFHAVREGKDQIAKLLSAKNKILFMCLLLWMIAMAAFLVFNSGAQSTFRGPLPT